jgi:hypothetical protein
MSEDELREQFETWWISGEVKLPVLVSEHSMFFADQAWLACAKIKDAEIAGLTKQRNAYKTADDARNKLIDWKVETGVKEKTKELNSLSSERDANAILTEEIEQLNTEVAGWKCSWQESTDREIELNKEIERLQNLLTHNVVR